MNNHNDKGPRRPYRKPELRNLQALSAQNKSGIQPTEYSVSAGPS